LAQLVISRIGRQAFNLEILSFDEIYLILGIIKKVIIIGQDLSMGSDSIFFYSPQSILY